MPECSELKGERCKQGECFIRYYRVLLDRAVVVVCG